MYYNARFYDPSIGRFLTADTIVPDTTDAQAFNRYAYVVNNPIKYTDPTGHFPESGVGGQEQKEKEKREWSSSKEREERSSKERKDRISKHEKAKEFLESATKKTVLELGKPNWKVVIELGKKLFNKITGTKSPWNLGTKKSATKWQNQMNKRGWSKKQIDEAISKGQKFKTENNINKGNPASRHVHPETGRSVVVDDITREVIHIGGDGFLY